MDVFFGVDTVVKVDGEGDAMECPLSFKCLLVEYGLDEDFHENIEDAVDKIEDLIFAKGAVSVCFIFGESTKWSILSDEDVSPNREDNRKVIPNV